MKGDRNAKNINDIDCQEAIKRLNDYLDKYLSDHHKEELEKHLALCMGCMHHYEFQQSLKKKISMLYGQCDPSLSNKLKNLLDSLP